MKFNLAGILFTTLTLGSAVVTPATAQVYTGPSYPMPNTGSYSNPSYPGQNPGGYPGSGYPGSSSPTYRPPTPTSTAFICGRVGNYPATLVQFNGRILQSPLIVFQTESQAMSLEQRCNDVSQRMTRAVAQNGGRLSNLLLTTGKVNRQAVICFVNTAESCNPSNVILTLLRPENARNAGNVLARIARFGRAGGGTAAYEHGGLGEAGDLEIEPASVSLEEAVNQLASESGGFDGATAPAANPNSGSYTPTSGADVGGGI